MFVSMFEAVSQQYSMLTVRPNYIGRFVDRHCVLNFLIIQCNSSGSVDSNYDVPPANYVAEQQPQAHSHYVNTPSSRSAGNSATTTPRQQDGNHYNNDLL
jgi:hypothetical protein